MYSTTNWVSTLLLGKLDSELTLTRLSSTRSDILYCCYVVEYVLVK